MIRLRSLICLSVVLACFIPAHAQGGKVIVEFPASKELKRTAHRLRVSVEQLKNAREALLDATVLAKKLEPSAMQPWALADMWIQLHRSKALTNMESVYDSLRIAAQEATDLQVYQQCTSAAQSLLTPFFELDADKATSLLQQWPHPSPTLGDSAQRINCVRRKKPKIRSWFSVQG